MNDVLIFLGFIALWFVLNKFLLPKMGVRTWMSGACELDASHTQKDLDDRELDSDITPAD